MLPCSRVPFLSRSSPINCFCIHLFIYFISPSRITQPVASTRPEGWWRYFFFSRKRECEICWPKEMNKLSIRLDRDLSSKRGVAGDCVGDTRKPTSGTRALLKKVKWSPRYEDTSFLLLSGSIRFVSCWCVPACADLLPRHEHPIRLALASQFDSSWQSRFPSLDCVWVCGCVSFPSARARCLRGILCWCFFAFLFVHKCGIGVRLCH